MTVFILYLNNYNDDNQEVLGVFKTKEAAHDIAILYSKQTTIDLYYFDIIETKVQ